MHLLDGKKTSEDIHKELADNVAKLKKEGKKIPHLAAVLVGNNTASESYVSNKVKACKKIGFESSLYRLEDTISEKQLLDVVNSLNSNDDIDGILVQLPLPKQISEEKIVSSINIKKDVDGFHPENFGRMAKGLPSFIPATPYGITLLLERYNIQTESKHCVVIGRSQIVGMPMAILMSRNTYPGNSTVTICHSKTKNLKEITLQADILIAAIGRTEFVTADMVKEGAVVVDVGINRVEDTSKEKGYRLAGDVNFNEVSPKCSFITPVPGGVGPMTIAGLLMNTYKSATNNPFN
jgi:methylenetetrahydrofolate dehydrogenase (NADP+) / methenyltetrahydrofolate cyclohydrolase